MVLVAGAFLFWAALAGDPDADLERGLVETEQAFTAVDEQLAKLDPDYQELRRQSLVLGLRETHDQIRSGLASLRSARVGIREDSTQDRRERLPRLRKLVNSADQLLVLATNLRQTTGTLVAFRKESVPLIAAASGQADLLEQYETRNADEDARIAALATSLTEIHQKLVMSEQLIRQDVEQGARFGGQTLTSLRTIVAEQRKLLGLAP